MVDFLLSKEVSEVLGAEGKFPQLNPEYDNRLKEDQKFLWAGWDFIYANDIGALLKQCERWFYDSTNV